MNPNELIIRFETVDRQTEGPVTRLVGFVRARNLLPLLDAADLEANPRTAKIGPITTDIIEWIETDSRTVSVQNQRHPCCLGKLP